MYLKVDIPEHFQFRIVRSLKDMLLRKEMEIHYIGGAEVLPPPLPAKEEMECIGQLVKEQSETARKKLIEHNLRLVVYIAKKFDNTGVGVEDLISIGTIGLIKAINTFNPEKNIKLATYASRCIENEILMYLRRNNKTKLEVSIDEPLNVDWDGNELLLSDILGTDEDVIYRDIETEVEKKLISRIYGEIGREIVEEYTFSKSDSIDDTIDYFKDANQAVKNIVFLNLVSISMEDDLYNTLEHLFLERIEKELGITAEKRKDLMQIVYDERDVREKAMRVIKY